MANTYTWRVPRVDSTPLLDGIALIHNETDRGEVEVIEIRITEPSETGPSISEPGLMDLVRVTSVTSATSDVVAALKMDTNSADLPSQVTFQTSGIETVGEVAPPLRRLGDCPQFSSVVGGALPSARVSTRFGRRGSLKADQIWMSTTFSGSEHLVLREGEGLALVYRSGVIPHAMTVIVTVRVQATGAVHIFRTRDIGSLISGRVVWWVLNGAGSGVLLEVLSVQMAEDGNAHVVASTPEPASVRLIRTNGLVPLANFSPSIDTAESFDTARTLPAGIKLYSGGFKAALVGYFAGVDYRWDTTDSSVANVAREQRAGLLRQVVRVPRVNRVGAACATPDNGFDVFKATVGRGIILRRGEGLAVAGGRAGVIDYSQFNYFDLRITFVHRPLPLYSPVGDNRLLRTT